MVAPTRTWPTSRRSSKRSNGYNRWKKIHTTLATSLSLASLPRTLPSFWVWTLTSAAMAMERDGSRASRRLMSGASICQCVPRMRTRRSFFATPRTSLFFRSCLMRKNLLGWDGESTPVRSGPNIEDCKKETTALPMIEIK